jgi:uncharacterized membrane protein YkvI
MFLLSSFVRAPAAMSLRAVALSCLFCARSNMSEKTFNICLWIGAALMAIVPVYLLFEKNISGAVVVIVPSFAILMIVIAITRKMWSEG